MENIEHIIRQPADRTRQTPLLVQHSAWHGACCWEQFSRRVPNLGLTLKWGCPKRWLNCQPINDKNCTAWIISNRKQTSTDGDEESWCQRKG